MRAYFRNIIHEAVEHKIFFLLFFAFVLLGAHAIIFFGKYYISAEINHTNSPFLDNFFYYVTIIGDGRFILAACVFLALIRIRIAVQVFIVFIISGIIAQIIKNIIQMPRPGNEFIQNMDLHVVKDVVLYQSYSFPSGHTITAFSVFCLLALLTKKKYLQFLCFAIALAVGISRVYLLQHFYHDIYFGAIIGVAVTLLLYPLIKNKPEAPWLDKPLLSLLRKNN